MNLLSMLKASATERTLHSRVGRWRQAVSRVLDSLAPNKYVITSMANAPQAIADLSVPTTIVLDSRIDGSVPYDAATGHYTLEANSIYELAFYPQWQSFNTEATDYATAFWANASGALLPHVTGTALPPTSTTNVASQPVVRLLYKTGSAEDVFIRSDGGQGAASVATDSYAIVRKLGSLT